MKRARVAISGLALVSALAVAGLGIAGLALASGEGGATDPEMAGTVAPRVTAGLDSGAAGVGLPAAADRTAVAPVVLEPHEGYNPAYLFAMTRGVAYSTLAMPLKPLLFVLTVPLDIVLLPFAAIGGLFG